jgi:hypothetical protein
VATILAAGAVPADVTRGADPSPAHRIYAQLMDPREHPDDGRRAVRPPDWTTLGNRTRFTTLRGFGIEGDRLVGFREELDRYVRTWDLGEVIWPAYPTLFARNLEALADEIKARDLFLFDLWGYVPGSGPGDYCQQFKAPREALAILESRLGGRWLGMDVGEQDGRYIGRYASEMHPASSSRLEQYLNFQRHFERLGDDMGNRLSTLVSLNFGHYFLKEGIYTSIGAETAQALPNGQVYYSFIRGAGKQYGVPWFGNASVYNRWGWKNYGPPAADHGPTKGTSLSLLKRLIYSHILYNSIFVGFESGWIEGDVLSPIGRIQQAAQRWVRQQGQPGTMMTPIALLLDFHAGWSFPRHLYTSHVYRVWGNLPYGPGDHLTDGMLDLLYPGYQDSSYFHDESGFITPTPYGDSADCLLSDAEGWLLDRYALLVLAGELTGGAELRDKLQAYADHGGHLVLTAGNLARLPGGLAGVKTAGSAVPVAAGTRFTSEPGEDTERFASELLPLDLPPGARVRTRCGNLPAVVEIPSGRGRITLLASPFGVPTLLATTGPIRNENDRPLARPYPLLNHVRSVLDGAFKEQVLFSAGPDLSLIVCRRAAGEYRLAVCNNSWRERPLRITSSIGDLDAVRELPLDASEKTATGCLPEGVDGTSLGSSGPGTIAGGDIRIFDVQVRETGVESIPHAVPPARPRGRILPLRKLQSIKEEILARPTFFEHFDGVVVDWAWLRDRNQATLQRDADWIARQRVRVLVDCSSGINLFPDLRLVDNIRDEYESSMACLEDLLARMQVLGARDLVVALHQPPENNFTGAQTQAALRTSLRRICAVAQTRGITLHLRPGLEKPPHGLKAAAAFAEAVGAANLRVASSTALLLAAGADLAVGSESAGQPAALWFVAAPETDVAGAVWNLHGRLASSARAAEVAAFLARSVHGTLVLDALYDDRDAEYADARILESGPHAGPAGSRPGD